MDIKLRARITAYSKVDSIEGTITDLPTVDKEHIDTLFEGRPDRAVTKEEIDSLFENSDHNTRPGVVSHSAIDSLFKK